MLSRYACSDLAFACWILSRTACGSIDDVWALLCILAGVVVSAALELVAVAESVLVIAAAIPVEVEDVSAMMIPLVVDAAFASATLLDAWVPNISARMPPPPVDAATELADVV